MASAEEGWSDIAMRYGLWFGAVFQLICILAILVFPSNRARDLEEHTIQEYSTEKSPLTTKANSKPRHKEKGTKKRR